MTTNPRNGWLFSSAKGQALHFTGSRWQPVSLGNVGPVTAAAGIAVKDAWAFTLRSNSTFSQNTAFAVHWNGSGWKTVPLPNLNLPKGGYLYVGSAYEVSSGNVWALGAIEPGNSREVLLHWNGRTLQQVTVPQDNLEQVVSDGNGGIWVIAIDPQGYDVFLHYSGGQWTSQAAPLDGVPGTNPSISDLYAMALIPGTQSLWATGDGGYNDPNGFHPFTAFFRYGT